MTKPTILAVDDDLEVSAAITRDLSYATEYRVMRTTSGPQAISRGRDGIRFRLVLLSVLRGRRLRSSRWVR